MRKLILVIVSAITILVPGFLEAQQPIPIVSGSITLPGAAGYYSVLLNQNVTSLSIAPSQGPVGSPIRVLFVENSTGSYTVGGLASNISGTITVATAANAMTAISFDYNSASNLWLASGGGGILESTFQTNGVNNQTNGLNFITSVTNVLGLAATITNPIGNQVQTEITSPSGNLTMPGFVQGNIQDAGGQVFNIAAFGAKCDDLTDDHTAIQNAINAAEAVGGTVLVPPGTGCVSVGNLVVNSAVTIRGVRGASTTKGSIINFTGTGGGVCSQGTNGFVQIESGNVEIEDVTLYISNNTAGTCLVNASVAAGEVSTVHLIHNNFVGGTTGSANILLFTYAVDSFKILRNTFQYAATMVSYGGSNFDAMDFEHNIFSEGTNTTDYMVKAQAGSFATNEVWRSNVFELFLTQFAATISSGNSVDFDSNYVGDGSGTGTSVGSPSVAIGGSGPCIVSNNFFENQPFLLSTNCTQGGATITGNTFLGGYVATARAVLTGNTFTPGTGVNSVSMNSAVVTDLGNYFKNGSNSFFQYAGTNYLGGYPNSQPNDLSVSKVSAAIIQFTLGQQAPSTFAATQTCSSTTEGLQATFTDSTTNSTGSVIAGGGAFHVLGVCEKVGSTYAWYVNGTGNPTGGVNSVAFSTTPTFNLLLGKTQQFSCTTSGSAIAPALSNLIAGLRFAVVFVQNSTTACTLTWPSNVHGGFNVGSTLSGVNVQDFVVSNNATDVYAEDSGVVNMTGGTP